MINRLIRAIAAGAIVSLLVTTPSDAASIDPQVKIETPDRNSVLTTSSIFVRGTAIAPTKDIGVSVNGHPALVDIEHAGTKEDPFRWFAEVSSEPGRVKLKARLKTGGSTTPDDEDPASTRHVQFLPPPSPVQLSALPAGGIAPLATTFTVAAGTLDVAKVEVDLDGDGRYEVTRDGSVREFAFTYTTPGLRIASTRITLSDGAIQTAAAAVLVYSIKTIDSVLQASWRGFTAALASGNVEQALAFVAPGAVEKYRGPLQTIKATLPQFATTLQTIKPMSFSDEIAHYLLTRQEEGELYGYHVYFVRDVTGAWKILQF